MSITTSAFLQKDARKPEQGSLEDLAEAKVSDETDRAETQSPQPLEPVCIQRRSPLIRNRKTGSMEVSGGAGRGETNAFQLQPRQGRPWRSALSL